MCKNAVNILSNKLFLFITMILMFNFLNNFPPDEVNANELSSLRSLLL